MRGQDRDADSNELKVTPYTPCLAFDEAHVLGLAALASSHAGQDPSGCRYLRSSKQKRSRYAETDQVRSVRSWNEDVRSDCHRFERGTVRAVKEPSP